MTIGQPCIQPRYLSDQAAIFKKSTPAAIKKGIIDTLHLVIQKEPENFKDILEKLTGLTAEEMQSFADLLKEVSLSSVIKASATMQNRLKFMEELRQIAYGDLNKVKERSQLHKIIENETWIFGKKYNFLASDNSFRTIVSEIRNKECGFIGKDEIVGDDYIPDLFLAKMGFDGETPKALIVELKRPSVKIGLDETTQIKKYFNTVISNP